MAQQMAIGGHRLGFGATLRTDRWWVGPLLRWEAEIGLRGWLANRVGDGGLGASWYPTLRDAKEACAEDSV